MAHSDENRDNRRRPRKPRRDEDPSAARERIEKDFIREMEMRIAYFIQSDEPELELEPMNSYRRRIAHNLASKYNMNSESRGEDRERRVCLVKTGETSSDPPQSKVRLWDYGIQTFTVNPGEKGIRMALKIDGSVELYREGEKKNIIADRVVEASEFRVRKGKILVPGESGY